MTVINYIIQPAFYKSFECIGDKCPINCCYGWGVIGWQEEEYTKLINADMPDELRQKIKSAFTVNKSDNFKFDYTIKYTAKRKCPMLTENGLCTIQKELGAEYLSKTCMKYPRDGRVYKSNLVRTCQLSCVHVVHMICNDENSMKLEKYEAEDSEIKKTTIRKQFTNHDKIKKPALNYELDIFNFFYEILSEKSRSIETSIVLSAMAAKKLDEFTAKGQADKIPSVLKALKPQLNDPVQIKKLENAKSNLSLKANFSGSLLKLLIDSDMYKVLFENGIPSEEKWQEGTDKFNVIYKDRPYAVHNIALNFFISNYVPFRDTEYTLFENFSYYAAQLSIVKLIAAITAMQCENEKIEEQFEKNVSFIDRFFTHDQKKLKKIIDYMRSCGCTTPAMLLGIIK